MSFSSTTARVQYTGDGTTVDFTVPFPFQADADLGVMVTTSGVDATKVVNVDYVVTGEGLAGGGNVRFTTAPASGTKVTIYRDLDLNQTRSFTYTGSFPTPTVTAAADKAMQAAQQLNEKIKRTRRVSVVNSEMPELAVADRAGTVDGWDTDGFPTQYPADIAVLPYSSPYVTSTITSLRAINYSVIATGTQVSVSQYATAGDGGGGLFRVDKSDTTTADNGGTVIVANDGTRLKRIDTVIVNALWFGAKFDGTTNDTAAIQAALDFVGDRGGGEVLCPEGTAIVTTLSIPNYTSLTGRGAIATTIKLANSSNVNCITNASLQPVLCGIYGIRLLGNDANNTAGASIKWNTGSTSVVEEVHNPSLIVRDVTIQNWFGDSSFNAACVIEGSMWVQFESVRIVYNRRAIGLYIKCSDSIFKDVYFVANGGSSGHPGVVIQICATNKFVSCYFGGGTGIEQVQIRGAEQMEFIDCTNDNAQRSAYRFMDDSGIPCVGNSIIGGTVSSSSFEVTNTYDGISFEGASSNNIVANVVFHNPQSHKSRYGVAESGTASNNLVVGCMFRTMGTGAYLLRSGSGSYVSGVIGASWTHQRSNLPGNFNGPDTSTPVDGAIIRANNGGKISALIGANAYTNAWIQALQDDGSNNVKPLILQPIGGSLQHGTSTSQIGFYGVSPISRPTLATGSGATVDDVITALQNLGLVKQS